LFGWLGGVVYLCGGYVGRKWIEMAGNAPNLADLCAGLVVPRNEMY